MAELNTLGSVVKLAYEGEANTNPFSDAEKAKLASIDADHFGDPLQDLAELTALPAAGLVDKVKHFVEDEQSDYFWNAQASSGDEEPDDKANPGVDPGYWLKVAVGGESAASVKTKYESNPDTNVFDDAAQTKLGLLNDLTFGALSDKALPTLSDSTIIFDNAAANAQKRSTFAAVLDGTTNDLTQETLHEYPLYDPNIELFARQPANPSVPERFGVIKLSLAGLAPPIISTETEVSIPAAARAFAQVNAAAKKMWLEKNTYPVGKELDLWSGGGGANQLLCRPDVFVNGLDNASADFTPVYGRIKAFQEALNEWIITGDFTNLTEFGAEIEPLLAWIKSGGTNGNQDIPDSSTYARALLWGANATVTTSQFLHGSSSIRTLGGFGNDHCVRIPATPDLELGLKDFLIRVRFRAAGGGANESGTRIIGYKNPASFNQMLSFYPFNTEIRANIGVGDTYFTLRSIGAGYAVDQDREVAIERVSGVFHMYDVIGGVGTLVDTNSGNTEKAMPGGSLYDWEIGNQFDGYHYESQIIVSPPAPLYNGAATHAVDAGEWVDPYAP